MRAPLAAVLLLALPLTATAREACIDQRDSAKSTLALRPHDASALKMLNMAKETCSRMGLQRVQEAQVYLAAENFPEAKTAAQEALDLFGDEPDASSGTGRTRAKKILENKDVAAATAAPPPKPGATKVPGKATAGPAGEVSADQCHRLWDEPRRNPDMVVECEKMAAQAIQEGKVYLMADNFADAEKSANAALELVTDPSVKENKNAKALLAEIKRRK